MKNTLYLLFLVFYLTFNSVYGNYKNEKASGSLFAKEDSLSNKRDSLSLRDSLNNSHTLNTSDTSGVSDSLSFTETQNLVRKAADSLAEVYKERFKEKQQHSAQLILLSALKSEFLKAKDYIEDGLDTNEINADINKIETEFKLASEGTQNDSGTFGTVRNFRTSGILMKELVTQLDKKKKGLDSYLTRLQQFRKTIDSLQTNPLMMTFAKDSALFAQYFEKFFVFYFETFKTDSALTSTIKTLNDESSRIDYLRSDILAKEQEVKENKVIISASRIGEGDSISRVLDLSYRKDKLVLIYFLENNNWLILLMAVCCIALAVLNKNIRKHIKDKSSEDFTRETDLILKYPVISAVFLVMMIFQFLFPLPPLIFQGGVWIIASLLLTIILSSYQTKIQKLFWMFLFPGFTVVLLCDLILGMIKLETVILLIITVASIIVEIISLRGNVFYEKRKIFRIILVMISIIFLVASAIMNLSGYYSLSKSLVSVSYFMLITAYLLYWTMVLGLEFTKVFTMAFEEGGNAKVRTQMKRFRARTPVVLKIFVFIGWIVLLARNFNIYDFLLDELKYFLEEERTIGDFTFSLETITIFFFIILLATVISKIIGFIADRSDSSTIRKSGEKGGLSNWMLLIRIGVMTAGLLLAFAATGIPTDRITIIIGSLGIGIGLGLQSIVNNLVSGILLAFEKPFRIGDRIEVSDKSGKIKEIGIRSSKLSTPEGSTVIVPNGDLLNEIVTNWTLRGSLRRSQLLLSFKYGAHLNELKEILQNILNNNNNVSKKIHPEVFLNNYGSSTAEYKLQYWTEIDEADKVRSEIMMKIEDELKEANIEISSDDGK